MRSRGLFAPGASFGALSDGPLFHCVGARQSGSTSTARIAPRFLKMRKAIEQMLNSEFHGYVADSLALAFPLGTDRKNRLVLALHGYFDDSGTHDQSSTACVAGYISTAEQWSLFDNEWSSALKEWDLNFFHMTDYSSRVGKYSEWVDDNRFNRLVGIINRHVIASVGCVFSKPSFDRIFTKGGKRFCGGAFGVAASSCFQLAAELLAPGYPSARIAYVFEAGTKGSGAVKRVFDWNYTNREQRESLKLLSLKFEGKEFTPLQAADVLACELYRHGAYAKPFDLGMLSACKLKIWNRLDDQSLMNYARVADVAARYHGHSGRRNTSGKMPADGSAH